MYTDCTRENACDGCMRCSCSAEATWLCVTVTECDAAAQRGELEDEVDEEKINSAMALILEEMSEEENVKAKTSILPEPIMPESQLDQVLDLEVTMTTESGIIVEEEDALLSLLREKRSVGAKGDDNENRTVLFHHIVDEINKDTLKNTNISGTLQASKIAAIPQASRRSTSTNNNLTSTSSLQIKYTPPINSQHTADNKVDTSAIHDDQVDLMVHHKIYEIVGNQSQVARDKDLSKIVVNELRRGESEIIGDKNSSAISNITFTSENDTLTAIAFIAGNLLNKLWNMEKDSSDSLETETMKHSKIDNLLELFKEPLNLRQENFLKNALEHLSTAIKNKNIGNVTLCQNIEELQKIAGLVAEPSQQQLPKDDNMLVTKKTMSSGKDFVLDKNRMDQLSANTAALLKITHVLDLIKKYENIQNTLSNMKPKSKLDMKTNDNVDENLTEDEKVTLNIFGNILETLTNLLLSNKKNKKLVKGLKNKNILKTNEDIIDKFKNLNLIDAITSKDKIVLDYLAHIQNNPNCVLKSQEKLLPLKLEGNILLNLSEFLKIKSMSDFFKLVDLENKKESNLRAKSTTTATTISEEITTIYTTETNLQNTEKEKEFKFKTTKEKLKSHLKILFEDLVELQRISGESIKGKNTKIEEILPCIYNLFNINKNLKNDIPTKTKPKTDESKKNTVHPVAKVTEVFTKLKKDLKYTSLTRRTSVGSSPRPKAAIVWERTINNLYNRNKLHTRRNTQSNNSKSIEDVKKVIDKIENYGSNTYKSLAYLAEVPPAERLLLLKTLSEDTKKYISALKDIRESIKASKRIQMEQHIIISEFIDNVNININLNRNILLKLNKPRKTEYFSNYKVRIAKTVKKYNTAEDTAISASRDKTVTLSRDQILNQLIRNRMNYYLRMKETTGDIKGSMNRDLAKRIILYLEIGNDNLARDLYKVFVSQNKKKPTNASKNQVPNSVKYKALNQQRLEKRPAYRVPEPLIQFQEPKEDNNEMSWLNQEQLLKQLVNIKNMKH